MRRILRATALLFALAAIPGAALASTGAGDSGCPCCPDCPPG
jgi:hypothetical protein